MIHLRPAQPDDAPALAALAVDVLGDALRHLPAEIAAPMVAIQARAREAGWRTRWPDHRHDALCDGAEVVGEVRYVDLPDHRLVIDLAVIPGRRGQGIGGAVLRDLIAGAQPRAVLLSVLAHNPAQALYRRLGFAEVDADGPYVRMRREPDPA
jgi:ribosomal protein S18 acetylase RimI-like enzyme